MNFTPCKRCAGYGYFPEYKHVENGICFRCGGNRYEELITHDGKVKDLESHLLSEKDCYDVADPCDISETRRIYEQGLNFYYGLNNFKKDREIALVKFRKAAINGEPNAQNNYGCLLCFDGREEEAIRWFLYSAMQGVVQAMYNLGMVLIEDDELSNKWFDLADKQLEYGEIDYDSFIDKDVDYVLVAPEKKLNEPDMRPHFQTLITNRFDNGHLVVDNEIADEIDDPYKYSHLVFLFSSLTIEEYCDRYELDIGKAFIDEDGDLNLPCKEKCLGSKILVLNMYSIRMGYFLSENDLPNGLKRFCVLENYDDDTEYDGTLVDIDAILSF